MNKRVNILFFATFLSASNLSATRQMEALDRGLHAVKTDNGVFVSWRFLGTDNKSTAFNIYRDGTLVNAQPITGATNLLDNAGSASSSYVVKTVENGKEVESSDVCRPWSSWWKSIQLSRPSNGTGGCSYTPNDMSVGDADGDGKYELFVKWDPSNAQDNSKSGTTGNVYLDCYKLDGTMLWRIDLGQNIRAGAHYTQFQVYDYDGDGKCEVVMKTAPGTKDGTGKYVLMGNDNPNANYRNSDGYILSGPEYLTIFNGLSGAEINTVAYNPGRGTVSSWGDKYGNRVDRFLACTAYLDGQHPSVVMCRGYYTRSTIAAYDFIDGKLVQRWFHDSPTSGQGAYGEGFHNVSVADVDNDGFDEIIYGSATIDHDGRLYSRTGYGHGDAMHVSRMFPDDNDFYGWFVHEDKGSAYGYELRNLRTNNVVFGKKTGTDVGRGFAADVDPDNPGFEFCSAADGYYYNKAGQQVGSRSSANFRLYWDGDLQDEIFDGQGTGATISKYNPSSKKQENMVVLGSYGNGSSCNSTKSTPCLIADILGDWREEVILYDANDPSKINIYTTTIETKYRLFTPMHDYVYRLGVAWQNTSYNQPPHLSNYIGGGVDNIAQPDIYVAGEVVKREPVRRVFNRGAENSDWNDAGNWIGGVLPTGIDTAEITNGEVDINGNYDQRIEFTNDGKLRVRGNSSLSDVEINNGGISVASSTQLFELTIGKLEIDGDASVSVGKSSDHHLTLKGGEIVGDGDVIKKNVGTLDIDMDAKMFTGKYIVDEGILNLNSENSIGLSGAEVKTGAILVNNANNTTDMIVVSENSSVVLNADLTVNYVTIINNDGEERHLSAGIYTSADFDWLQGDKTLKVVVGVDQTGVEQITYAEGISVYPNPANDMISVYVDGAIYPNAIVVVTDVTGKDRIISKMSNSIDVSTLTPGIYMLRVEIGNRFYYEKLTIR
ncbi:MAG: T9SS type A sorting domain-containing protein [Bacteroidales bacterium]|jgi:rhamnogalacturonan endolyase|nr:T9SS type A sorting domain-containing protein [Bacteroidales bacterium]